MPRVKLTNPPNESCKSLLSEKYWFHEALTHSAAWINQKSSNFSFFLATFLCLAYRSFDCIGPILQLNFFGKLGLQNVSDPRKTNALQKAETYRFRLVGFSASYEAYWTSWGEFFTENWILAILGVSRGVEISTISGYFWLLGRDNARQVVQTHLKSYELDRYNQDDHFDYLICTVYVRWWTSETNHSPPPPFQ